MPKRATSMSVLFTRYAREAPMNEVQVVMEIVKDILKGRVQQEEIALATAPPKVKRRGRGPNKKKVEKAETAAATVEEEVPQPRVAPVPPKPREPRLPKAPGGPPPFRGGMPSGAMPPMGGGQS